MLGELAMPKTIQPPSESRCVDCHDMAELSSQSRPGYWHFEKVHRALTDRSLDCRHCHSELSPYREDDHRIRPQSLAASCVLCHVAQE